MNSASPAGSAPLGRSTLLIVDGKDPLHFLEALRDHLGLQGEPEVRDYGGNDNPGGYLQALKNIEGFSALRSLGVCRDAETDARAAFSSVEGHLRRAGFVAPVGPLVRVAGSPSVAVLINPPGRGDGALEDLCLGSLEGQPRMDCLARYIDCLASIGWTAPAVRASKTRVHAYIAACDRPESSLGVAAKRGYFPFDHDAFDAARRFVRLVASP